MSTKPHQGALAIGLVGAALAFDPHAAAARTPKLALATAVTTVALALWRPRRVPLGATLWLATAGWLAASLAWSTHPDPAGVLPWLVPAALAVVLAGARDLDSLAGRSATAIIAATSGVAVAQALAGRAGIAVHGLMGNPNWLGLAIAVAAPLAVAHRGRVTGRERTVVGGALLLGVAGLGLAQSRVAVVALVLVMALSQKRRWLTALALAMTVGLAAVARDALVGRGWLLRIGLDTWLDKPIIGHGLGGFRPAFLAVQGDRLAEVDVEAAAAQFLHATTAHDDWLQLAIEGGVIALLLGVAAFAAALLVTRSAAGRASLAVAAIAMLGDATLRQPAAFLVLAFPLADAPRLPARRRDLAVPVLLVAAGALLLPPTLTRWLAERAAHAAVDAPPKERLVSLERAHGIAPTWQRGRLTLALARLETGDARGALDLLRTEPADLSERIARGNALIALDRPAEARVAYRAALALHPGSFRARANLAEALRREGELEAAAEQLRLARALQPHHPKVAALAERLRRDRIDAATR